MERFFLELLNRAICAGWLVLAILVLRVVLKKVPKWMRCLLWGMVAVRLLVPIQIESAVSLIPSVQTVSPDVIYAERPEIHTGIGMLNSAVNPAISDYFAPKPENSVNPVQVIAGIASWVWLAGVVFMLIWAAVSYVRLRLLVRTAVLVKTRSSEDGEALPQELSEAHGVSSSKIPVMESEHVDSPFVIGLFRPRIYLPVKLQDADRNFIISHETAHIHRKDHWVKPFGYLLLAVYWFHPLLWAAYIMLCRDIEYACDERVVKQYNVEERKAYSTALLACSVRRMRIAACPVAFGEVGVRKRVKSVLHYKKPAFWVLVAAALSLVAVAVCFLTNPRAGKDAEAGGGTKLQGTENGDGTAGTEGAGVSEPGMDGTAGGTAGTEGADVGAAGMDGAADGAAGSDGMQNGGSTPGTMDLDDETAPAGVAVPAEGWYEFDHCIYMNPLSSYLAMEGEEIKGYLDAEGLTWNEFGGQTRLSYKQASGELNVDTVPWSMFGADELKSMFEIQYEQAEAEIEGIEALPAEKRLWRPLQNGYHLLYVDGELWLMRILDERSGVWSIYALRPRSDALSDAVAKAAWDWAEEKGAFGGVTRMDAAAEGVTGELWATYPCVSFCILATESSSDAATGENETLTVYAQVLATAFLCENTGITELGGTCGPAAITFLVNDDGSYTLSEYWTPRDGSYYVTDIRERFPEPAADAAIDGQRYADALMRESYAKAVSETGVVDTWSVVHELLNRMLLDEDDLLEEDADAAGRIAAYPLTVRELTYYGEDTLRYLYSQFMQGGENGFKGELMARVMHELICKEIQLRMPLTDGQAYFDALCENVQKTYEDLVQSEGGRAQAERYMREYMPTQYLLFSMLESRVLDAEADSARNEDLSEMGALETDGTYEYYLTEKELAADVEQGWIFRVDTSFCRQETPNGRVYPAPYVDSGVWPFYVHEDNTVNLEITKDTSIKEQISVTPGEWTLKVSFAYTCGDVPARLRIAAAYETLFEEDLDWLKEKRLTQARQSL